MRNTSSIERLTFHCTSSNRTFLLHNKISHEKIECQICIEEHILKNFNSCERCSNKWCSDCDKKFYKCPFCRKDIFVRNCMKIRERRGGGEIEEENRNLLSIQLESEIHQDIQRNMRVNNRNTFQSLIQGLTDLERRLEHYSRNVPY